MPDALRCVCGHQPAAHEHYRDGSNCGTCGPVLCPAYRRARWWRRARRTAIVDNLRPGPRSGITIDRNIVITASGPGDGRPALPPTR